MRFLLLVAALVAFLLAAGSLLGVLVHLSEPHALGYIAVGLALYILSLSPLPRPPRR